MFANVCIYFCLRDTLPKGRVMNLKAKGFFTSYTTCRGIAPETVMV